MKIIFLGVGEAFDENNPNVSLLVESEKENTRLLVDCGYDIPKQLWRQSTNPEFIDGIYVSHFHADHIFGIPPLLIRMYEDGRRKPLPIISHPGLGEYLRDLLERAYPGTFKKLPYELRLAEGTKVLNFRDLQLTFAYAKHSIPVLSVRIFDGNVSVSYSGDGELTDATRALYLGSNLLVHEAYTEETPVVNHTTMKEVVDYAKRSAIRNLALVHLRRDIRSRRKQLLNKFQNEPLKVMIPEPLEEIRI